MEQQFYKDDIALLAEQSLRGEETIYFEVKVVEIKKAYGHTRYVVQPVAGKGQITTEKLIKNG